MRATDNSGMVTVVGIGSGGWPDLSRTAGNALTAADVILGSDRQLALLPAIVHADRVAWPSPLLPALPALLEARSGRRICVLASGDPMFHGIGATLVRLLGAERVHVIAHPSSVSLAAARLGWPLATTDVLSLVTAEPATLHRLLNPGRRILVLSRDAATPATIAALLTTAGYGTAELTVLEQLGAPTEHTVPGQPGAPAERVITGTAATWSAPPGDPLNIVAIACGQGPATSLVPGLPDAAYETDGQLTKREVRAVTLAMLAPTPGALLWDVGAGSGSIGIEWLRSHPSCRAIAIESDPSRAATIATNAATLGVPALQIVLGRAPDALAALPTPDTIFIGGGLTRPGVLDMCLKALRPGGRLVANAVTLETEAVLTAAHTQHGGTLTRLSIHRTAPIGSFTGWKPHMPVTIWTLTTPAL